MKPFRSTLAALAVAGAAVGTGFFGFEYVQKSQFAQAAEQVQLSREQLAKADDLASVFRYVGKAVEPSVVNINVTKKSNGNARGNGGRLRLPLDKDQLRRFFPDRDGDGQPDVPDLDTPDDLPFEQHGTGSGVIMEVGDGYAFILTNNHVAGGASAMEITLSDGRKITKATTVGADAKTDLAVVKVEADRLIPAKWGNSDELQKGDWIMAFGSPFGYVGSMTHGIVSALNRHAGILGQQGYENFIQVDAPINPGNSGGPLVNVRGEVVGVNTAIASRTGAFSGIGFAIPSNQARFVFESLKKNGKVTRGWLGVAIIDVASDTQLARSRFGYEGTTGVLVQQVQSNTPATGKLKRGDIITAIDGKGVETVQQLRNQIAARQPNSDVKLTVFRDGKEQTVGLRLGEQPEDMLAGRGSSGGGGGGHGDTGNMPDAEAGKLGLRLGNPNDELLKKWDLGDVKGGAVVTAVERNSLAAKAGINPGDVITEVGKSEVKDAKSATDAMAGADLKKGLSLYVTSKDPDSGQLISRYVLLRDEH
jgi:serine protease Do